MRSFLPAHRGGLLFLCLLLTTALSAQQTPKATYLRLADRPEVASLQFSAERGTPTLIELDAATAKSNVPADAAALLDTYFALPASKLTAKMEKTTTDRSGLQVDRYQEYYRGVKIEHGRYNAVSADGQLRLLTSEHYDVDPRVSVTPTLSREAALDRALAFVGAREYAWEYIEGKFVRKVCEVLLSAFLVGDDVVPEREVEFLHLLVGGVLETVG